MTEQDVIKRLDAAVIAAGSARALAMSWGISPSYVSDILAGTRRPGPKVLGPLGLEVVTTRTYRQAGAQSAK